MNNETWSAEFGPVCVHDEQFYHSLLRFILSILSGVMFEQSQRGVTACQVDQSQLFWLLLGENWDI